jgi:hypothetical protein
MKATPYLNFKGNCRGAFVYCADTNLEQAPQ